MRKILIICGLTAFLLSGCSQNKSEMSTEVVTEASEETQAETQSESESGITPEYDLGAIGDELNKKYTGNDQYPGTVIEFQINSAVNKAQFGITVKNDTSPEAAAEYAETILKAFNDLIAEQDSTIKKSRTDSFGGFYDNYIANVKVTPESKKEDPSSWLVDTTIDSSSSNKILPIAKDNSLLESENGENKEETTPQVPKEDDMEKDEDQDVQHGPGTVPTEPATFETKPE